MNKYLYWLEHEFKSMRMHLVCYWQGNTEQSLQLKNILGFFRGVKWGGMNPEGFELLVTSSPKPCRVGRAQTHPTERHSNDDISPTPENTTGTRGGSPPVRCLLHRFFLVHSGQRGITSQRDFQILPFSHFWEPPPCTAFHKKSPPQFERLLLPAQAVKSLSFH